MGKLQDQCFTLQQSSSEISNILGDFYIENHHCWIVCPEADNSWTVENVPQFCPIYFGYLVIGNLNISGKDCLIIQAKPTAKPPIDGVNDAEVTHCLTERELQIVQLVAQGYANKQIAHQLHISIWTVSTHLRRVFAKLGVDSRAAMVYRCTEWLKLSG